jgi:hypothetical protein
VPFELPLPKAFAKVRWKVKIREKELRHPPHVSIIRGTDTWRINLRTGEFMDKRPKPSDVPDELLGVIRSEENWKTLCEQWDQKYPDNPVVNKEEEDKEDGDDPADAK